MLFSAGGRLFMRSIGEVEATPVQGFPDGLLDVSPVFSPDGQSVGFWDDTDRTLKRLPVVGGQALTIAQGPRPLGMTWGPDGLVVADTAGVLRVLPDGSTTERLVQLDSDEGAHSPQLLPGGEFVMFTLVANAVQADRVDTAHVVAQSLASGERRTLIRNGSDARYLPTGHIVYAVAGTVYGVAFDLATLTVRGEAVPVVSGVRRAVANRSAATQFSVSSNGSLLYLPGPANAVEGGRVPTLVDRAGTLCRWHSRRRRRRGPGSRQMARGSPSASTRGAARMSGSTTCRARARSGG